MFSIGQKIGRWTVTGERCKGERKTWHVPCVCECGARKQVRGQASA